MLRWALFIAVWWVLAGCSHPDYYALPATTDGQQVIMVVEIAAGTSLKTEYDNSAKRFLPDSVNGKARLIKFLPYPVNYGFIPSTLQSKEEGGDGDPLDVMMIGPALPTGTIVKVIPLGVLRLKDRGETDDKILVIAADPDQRAVEADDFSTLTLSYPAILTILEEWFVNYKGIGVTQSLGWGDDSEAWRIIDRYRSARTGIPDDKSE